MTISSTESRKAYVGNGVTQEFPFPHKFLSGSDLTVYADGVVLSSGYFVTGDGNEDGGTVSFIVAPATGVNIVIVRELAAIQELDLVENDPLPAEAVEDALDRAAMVSQYLSDKIGRAITLADSDVSGASLVLPAPSAGKGLKWNDDASAIVYTQYDPDDYTTSVSTVLAAAAEATAAADAAEAAAATASQYAGVVGVDTFSGNGATVEFTLSSAPSTEDYTQVFVNGVYQSKGTYGVDDVTLTFSEAPPTGTDNVEVVITTLRYAEEGGIADGDKGDVTVTGNGATWTIDNKAVSYAKIQDVSATDKLLGRSTAGAGSVEEIACTAAGRALLDDANAAAQRSTLGLGTAATAAATDFATAAHNHTGTYQPLATVLTNTTASFTTTLKTKLDGIAEGAEVNVNADWNAGSGDAQILNKPTLGTAAAANLGTGASDAAYGNHAHSGVYEPADATILKSAAIGVSVQGYDADTAKIDAAQSWTAQQTFKELKDTVYTITDGAAFEIDPANGSIQVVTLGGNRTPAATNFEAGQIVMLGIDDGSAYAITWSGVTWVKPGGSASAPTLATSGYTWVLLWKVSTTLYAAEVGKP